MMRHRSLVGVAGLILLGLLAVVLFYETGANGTDWSAHSDSIDFKQDVAAQSGPELEGEPPQTRSEENRERVDSSSTTRTILVTDEAGKPVPQAVVCYLLAKASTSQAESLRKLLSNPEQLHVDQVLSSRHVVQANENGVAEIPSIGFGVAACVFEDLHGILVIEEASSELVELDLTLVLRRSAHHLVKVLDHNGVPVPNVGVSLQLVDAQRMKQAVHDGQRYGSPMPLCVARLTNADGKAWLPFELKPFARDNIAKKRGSEQIVASVALPFRTVVYSVVDPVQPTELTLYLPELGEAFIKLIGYPSESRAWIKEDPGPGNYLSQHPARPEPNMPLDGFAHYRFIPLEIDLVASIMRQVSGRGIPGRGQFRGSSLPKHRLKAPTAADVPIRVELFLDEGDLLRGRLLNSNDQPLKRDTKWADEVFVHAFGRDGQMDEHALRMEVFPDGKFIASPVDQNQGSGSSLSRNEIARLRIQYYARHLPPLKSGQVRHMWAEVEVEQASPQLALQLGDIRLSQSELIALQAQVTDRSGQPIPNASVKLEYEVTTSEGVSDWKRFDTDPARRSTGHDGKVFFLEGIWGEVNRREDLTGQYRVRASARDFIEEVRPFSGASTSLEIALDKSLTLVGEVVLPKGVRRPRVIAKPMGWNAANDGGDQAQLQANLIPIMEGERDRFSASATHWFQIEGMRDTEYELSFGLKRRPAPLLQLKNIRPGDASELPVPLDLRPYLRVLEFSVGIPGEHRDGQALLNAGLHCAFLGHDTERPSSESLHWMDSVIRWVGPADLEGKLVFKMPGMRNIEVDLDSPRHQRLQFSESPITRVLAAEVPPLAPGESLQLRIYSSGSALQHASAVESDSGAGWAYRFSAAGKFNMSWSIVNQDGVQLDSAADGLTLTQTQLNSTEPIVLKVPEKLFKRDER